MFIFANIMYIYINDQKRNESQGTTKEGGMTKAGGQGRLSRSLRHHHTSSSFSSFSSSFSLYLYAQKYNIYIDFSTGVLRAKEGHPDEMEDGHGDARQDRHELILR